MNLAKMPMMRVSRLQWAGDGRVMGGANSTIRLESNGGIKYRLVIHNYGTTSVRRFGS